MALHHNYGLALRAFQGILLASAVGLLLGMSRSGSGEGPKLLGLGGVTFATFMMTNAFWMPAFLGFTFGLAGIVMVCLSRACSSRTPADLLAGCAGAALACTGLVRPVFAAYALLAVLGVELALRDRGAGEPGGRRRLFVLLGAMAASVLLIWILLYPRLSPISAIESTILVPARLIGGGQRLRNFNYLLRLSSVDLGRWGGPLMAGIVATALASWIGASRLPRVRALVAAVGVAAALGAARLPSSPNPGFEVTIFSGVLVLAGLAAVFLMRTEIRESAALAAGAVFGLTSMAFGHYFWTRADMAHLPPPLAFAAIAAAIVWPKLSTGHRTTAALFFGILALVVPQLPVRLAYLAAVGAPLWRSPLPAASVPRDAAGAVRFADEQSDPSSRFVAVASMHVLTSGNPVRLFLLSSRLPYTKWYTYDPGLQSSPEIQAEMARDLARSGSRVAVVWEARRYLYDSPTTTDPGGTTDFDEVFRRLYPIRAARFGEYEVRLRAE